MQHTAQGSQVARQDMSWQSVAWRGGPPPSSAPLPQPHPLHYSAAPLTPSPSPLARRTSGRAARPRPPGCRAPPALLAVPSFGLSSNLQAPGPRPSSLSAGERGGRRGVGGLSPSPLHSLSSCPTPLPSGFIFSVDLYLWLYFRARGAVRRVFQ